MTYSTRHTFHRLNTHREFETSTWLTLHGARKVRVSREGVAAFNSRWPCSELRDRSYWFEFDSERNLVDTDVPEHDDGRAAHALSQDCENWLFDGRTPEWLA